MIKQLLFLFAALALATAGQGQSEVGFIPLNEAWSTRLLADIDSLGHTQVRPLNPFTYGAHRLAVAARTRWEAPLGSNSWLANAIFNEDLFAIERPDFSLAVQPILDISLGQDSRQTATTTYLNSRGLALQGHLGDNVAFSTEFRENQARFPVYVAEWIGARSQRPQRVVPGQGIPKVFKKDPTQYDFAAAAAQVNWQMSKIFNLELGYGKNFIGEGYRSLLLSDNAFNYPYLRLQTSFWKIQYTNLYAQLQDVNSLLPDGTYPRKYMVSHYLSVNIGKKLNVGIYETVIYGDSTRTRGLDLAYLNPILFYRPIEFANGSQGGNVLLGLTATYRMSSKLRVYGQFVLDEFKVDEWRAGDGWWGNKFGVQLGLKGQLAQPELQYRLEVNTVRPYTYAHSETLQNYGHYNQALAHPLGSNFREVVGQLNYYRGRWLAEAQLNWQQTGLDTLGSNWGGNIYLPNGAREQEYNNTIAQGIQATTLLVQAKIGWIINPANNLRLEAGYLLRDFQPDLPIGNLVANQTNYLFVGLRTALNNLYFDF
ncbi:MAG: hypothetical protein DA408_21395 [Bacteroidetes bacterium]|nr:MAG: hypothetical protein DA408_21395 [Bacteroidota bacterium]